VIGLTNYSVRYFLENYRDLYWCKIALLAANNIITAAIYSLLEAAKIIVVQKVSGDSKCVLQQRNVMINKHLHRQLKTKTRQIVKGGGGGGWFT